MVGSACDGVQGVPNNYMVYTQLCNDTFVQAKAKIAEDKRMCHFLSNSHVYDPATEPLSAGAAAGFDPSAHNVTTGTGRVRGTRIGAWLWQLLRTRCDVYAVGATSCAGCSRLRAGSGVAAIEVTE